MEDNNNNNNSLENLHEEHLRCLDFCSISNTLLWDLLGYFLVGREIELDGGGCKILSNDREVALAELIQLKEEFQNYFKKSPAKEIFSSTDLATQWNCQDTSRISFDRLDVTLCVNLLLHIRYFLTNRKDNNHAYHKLRHFITVVNNLRKLVTHSLVAATWVSLKDGPPFPNFHKENFSSFDDLIAYCYVHIKEIAEFLKEEKCYSQEDLDKTIEKLSRTQKYKSPDFLKMRYHQISKQLQEIETSEKIVKELRKMKETKKPDKLSIHFHIDEDDIASGSSKYSSKRKRLKKSTSFQNKDVSLNSQLSKSVLSILNDHFNEITGETSSERTYEVVLEECKWADGNEKFYQNSVFFECYIKGKFEEDSELLKGSSKLSESIQERIKKSISKTIKNVLGVDATIRFNRWKEGSLIIQGNVLKWNETEWAACQVDKVLLIIENSIMMEFKQDINVERVGHASVYPGRIEFSHKIIVHRSDLLGMITEEIEKIDRIKTIILEKLHSSADGFMIKRATFKQLEGNGLSLALKLIAKPRPLFSLHYYKQRLLLFNRIYH